MAAYCGALTLCAAGARRTANVRGWYPVNDVTSCPPCTVAEPDSMQAFWRGWLKWSVEAGIDYFVGRKIPAWLDSLGLEDVAGEGNTAQFNGGSDWATYWIETVRELTPSLLKSNYIDQKMLEEFDSRYRDSHYWTSLITLTANWGHKPA